MKSDKMHSVMNDGSIYDPGQPEMLIDQLKLIQRVNKWNRIPASPLGYLRRTHLLKKMFASVGENCYIEPPFHSNWGGHHVHFGNWVYANFNLTLVDDADIFVADHVMFGPNVTLVTASHPLGGEYRSKGLQYSLPIHIEKNCWIGANAVILPGITIGEGSVVGACSLVTKDIPPHSLAYGVPCKVIRPLDERDADTYQHGMKIPERFKKPQ